MSTAVVESNKWRKWLRRLMIASTLMGVSISVGVAFTVFIAIRILLAISATGMTMGMVGLTAASVHATTNVLHQGDSATRLAVLTQLKQTVDTQPSMAFDSQTSTWIVPALEHCKTDADSRVVRLAEELAATLKEQTLPPAQ